MDGPVEARIPDRLPFAALLVGGQSRRFGTDKSEHKIAGRTFLEWVLDAADDSGLPTLLVGGDPEQAARLGRIHVSDDGAGSPAPEGPTAGLAAALALAAHEGRPGVVLLACDQPGMRASVLRFLLGHIAEAPATPLAFAGPTGLEPFPAYYPVSALGVARGTGTLRGVLSAARPSTRVIAKHERAAFPDWVFDNINTPDDLVRHLAKRP